MPHTQENHKKGGGNRSELIKNRVRIDGIIVPVITAFHLRIKVRFFFNLELVHLPGTCSGVDSLQNFQIL